MRKNLSALIGKIIKRIFKELEDAVKLEGSRITEYIVEVISRVNGISFKIIRELQSSNLPESLEGQVSLVYSTLTRSFVSDLLK